MRALVLVLILGSSWIVPAAAKVYLEPAEALRLCLPQAENFKAKDFTVTPEIKAKLATDYGIDIKADSWRVVEGSNAEGVTGYVIPGRAPSKRRQMDYVIALNPDFSIRQVEILAYRESHGAEIRQESWRRQFYGHKDPKQISYPEKINNISGATISVRNLTRAIQKDLALAQFLATGAWQ